MPGKRHATEEARRAARLESYRQHAARKRAERRREDTRAYVRGRTVEEAKAKRAEKDRLRNSSEDAKARRRLLQRARYNEKLRACPRHKAKQVVYFRTHYEKNVDYYTAKGSESARRKRRTFGTLSPEHKEQVVALYWEARLLTESTGIPHEVDHIEPLRGKRSCGLHVPWNLRVMTRAANRAKGNRLEQHQPDPASPTP